VPAKFQSFVAVQNVGEWAFMNVSYRAVEKTGPDCTIGLDYGGNPRGITSRSRRLHLTELHTEMKGDTSKLRRAFHDKSRFNLLSTFTNECFDFDIKQIGFGFIQSDSRLSLVRPAIGSIKRFRSRVGREE